MIEPLQQGRPGGRLWLQHLAGVGHHRQDRHGAFDPEQGFTAIQGVGGFLNFSTDKYEMLHRTFIYAPGNQAEGQERFELSARMLKFPNGGTFTPPTPAR